MSTPLVIRPDIDQAAADFAELKRLSERVGFDLSGALDSLADSFTPVFDADIDDKTAPTIGHAIARYKLAERLQGALAALRARNVQSELINGQGAPPFEITSEMIEAEIDAFYGPDWGREPAEVAVERIYRAMWLARLAVGRDQNTVGEP